jgi:hypothetical protein
MVSMDGLSERFSNSDDHRGQGAASGAAAGQDPRAMTGRIPRWGGAERVAFLTSVRLFAPLPPAILTQIGPGDIFAIADGEPRSAS